MANSDLQRLIEGNKMKMMDCVELIVEKPNYAKDGVHKGMQGWICLNDGSHQSWLVNFPQYGEKDDIAEIVIKEEDMKLIPVMDVKINEKIKEQFDRLNQKTVSSSDEDDSCYLA